MSSPKLLIMGCQNLVSYALVSLHKIVSHWPSIDFDSVLFVSTLCRNLRTHRQHRDHSPSKADDPRGMRAPGFPYWFGPICMICPLAPMPDKHFITAVEVRTTQQWLINISIRELLHISSSHARLVSRWRVGANDQITSDTNGSAQSLSMGHWRYAPE